MFEPVYIKLYFTCLMGFLLLNLSACRKSPLFLRRAQLCVCVCLFNIVDGGEERHDKCTACWRAQTGFWRV